MMEIAGAMLSGVSLLNDLWGRFKDYRLGPRPICLLTATIFPSLSPMDRSRAPHSNSYGRARRRCLHESCVAPTAS